MTTRFSLHHVGLAILVVMVTASVGITSGAVIPGLIATGYPDPTTATIATGYPDPTTATIATGYPDPTTATIATGYPDPTTATIATGYP